MLANTLKTAAMAALLGLGVTGTSSTAASAYTIRTRCDGDACVRMQCDNYGDNCYRTGNYQRDDYDQPYGYSRTYTYYPYSYDFDEGYYRDYDGYHYRNHYDYDNDYNEDAYPPG